MDEAEDESITVADVVAFLVLLYGIAGIFYPLIGVTWPT
jgi:hypothetical protein